MLPETVGSGETYSGHVQGAWKSSVATNLGRSDLRNLAPTDEGTGTTIQVGAGLRALLSPSSGSPRVCTSRTVTTVTATLKGICFLASFQYQQWQLQKIQLNLRAKHFIPCPAVRKKAPFRPVFRTVAH